MKYPKTESRKRSMTRSVIWRIFGILFLATVTYIFTKSWITTSLVTVLHHGIFIFVYYAQERMWVNTSFLRDSKFKPFARIAFYEIILGNLILGAITLILTGSLHTMTAITLTYTFNKYWFFYLYDWVWTKIEWEAIEMMPLKITEEEKKKSTVVYTYQVADLFHVGHGKSLEQAKALGDYLIVGVLTDEATEAYKRQPIIPFEQRMYMVSHFDCVDEVVRQETLDPTDNIKRIKPDIITHSHEECQSFPGGDIEKYIKKIGKKAIRTEYFKGQTTTKILNKIKVRQWVRPHTLKPKGIKVENIVVGDVHEG